MKYYYGSKTDSSFALYEIDGRLYPVFAEKYGTEEVKPKEEKPADPPAADGVPDLAALAAQAAALKKK